MTFESEWAGRAFYVEYARRVGFATRVLSSRRSQYENCVISRALGCREVLHAVKDASMKQRYRQREGCEAMILIQREKNGTMWVVRKFVKDHSHPLTADSPLNGHLSSDRVPVVDAMIVVMAGITWMRTDTKVEVWAGTRDSARY
ncbi:unnamed protein product [Cuscuta europaea]|uniref:FAR1 domain-containing protein n=1 Tax=Cuscuta europaea TaxID=41803 RepID=A0A9P0YSN8_CUSEU|nr:unnamed protein product [Cuscuta europaea]